MKFLRISTAILALLPLAASAQWMTGPTNLTFADIAVGLLNLVWIAFTVIAIVAFVIAGIMFLTAFGDPEKLAKAKSAFIWVTVRSER